MHAQHKGLARGLSGEVVVNSTAPSRTRRSELLELGRSLALISTWHCSPAGRLSSSSFLDRSPGNVLLPGRSVTAGGGSWQMSPPADCLCLTQAQAPASKRRVSSLPTTSGGKRFQLWVLGIFCTERHLAKCLKNNSFYPFVQQQPNGARGWRRGTEIRGRGLGLGPAGAGAGPAPGAPLETAGGTLTAAASPAWGGLFPAGALAPSPPAASRGRLSSRGPAASSPVFVLEYYLDTLWKGTLLFVVCLFLISCGLVSQV